MTAAQRRVTLIVSPPVPQPASSTLPVAPDQVEASAAQMSQIDLDLQRVRQANEQLSDACEKLREANAEGLADPKLIDTAVIAELESLRATRAIEMAEIDAVLSALAPLVEETEAEDTPPPTSAEATDEDDTAKTGDTH